MGQLFFTKFRRDHLIGFPVSHAPLGFTPFFPTRNFSVTGTDMSRHGLPGS